MPSKSLLSVVRIATLSHVSFYTTCSCSCERMSLVKRRGPTPHLASANASRTMLTQPLAVRSVGIRGRGLLKRGRVRLQEVRRRRPVRREHFGRPRWPPAIDSATRPSPCRSASARMNTPSFSGDTLQRRQRGLAVRVIGELHQRLTRRLRVHRFQDVDQPGRQQQAPRIRSRRVSCPAASGRGPSYPQ